MSVNEMFARDFGGTKELSGVDEIMQAIIIQGLVVSTLFEPNEAFLNHNSALLHHQTECLIVGWKQQPAGEVWIVAPLIASILFSKNTPVSFGRYSIADCCLAPINSLGNSTWEAGPYLDINMTGVAVKKT